MYWLKNNRKIKSSPVWNIRSKKQKHILQNDSIQKSDNGKYRCVASNDRGEIDHVDVEVKVKGS